MKTKFIIGLILTLLLIVPLTYAGVTIIPDAKINEPSLCPRETSTLTDVVWNTGAKVEQVSLSLEGSAAKWTSIAPNGFFLSPGEQKSTYLYITPKADAAPGDYELTLVSQSSGEKKIYSHTVTVKKCFDVAITSNVITQQVCPSGTAKYEFYITNTGLYQEGFTLSLEGNLKGAVLSDTRLNLASGDTKKVYVYATAPSKDGEYSFNVVVIGDSGKSTNSQYAILDVMPCYDFFVSVNADTAYGVCDHTVVEVPVKLKNVGTIRQEYKIKLHGENWGILSKDSFDLFPNTEGEFKITFAPDYNILGKFNYELEVIPEYGDKKGTTTFSFDVRDCNAVSLNLSSNELEVCNFGGNKNVNAIIKNQGEFVKQYKLAIKEMPLWVNINGDTESVFTLKPGEEIKKTINILPSVDVAAKEYVLIVGAGSLDDANELATDEISVDVLSQDVCYIAKLSSQYNEVTVYKDASVMMPLTIKNEGKEVSNYELSLTGAASDFVILKPSTLTVAPGETSESYLYIAPNIDTKEAEYLANINLKLVGAGSLDNKEIKINITGDVSIITPLENATAEEISFWDSISQWFSNVFGGNEEQFENNSTLQADEDESSWFDSIWSKLREYRYYILGLIILLLVIVILVRTGTMKKVSDFFLEDEDDEINEEAEEIKKAVEKPSKKKVTKKVVKKEEEPKDEE